MCGFWIIATGNRRCSLSTILPSSDSMAHIETIELSQHFYRLKKWLNEFNVIHCAFHTCLATPSPSPAVHQPSKGDAIFDVNYSMANTDAMYPRARCSAKSSTNCVATVATALSDGIIHTPNFACTCICLFYSCGEKWNGPERMKMQVTKVESESETQKVQTKIKIEILHSLTTLPVARWNFCQNRMIFRCSTKFAIFDG